MSSDRHAHWDAAYVLGALSAAERQEYEDHLTSCPSCRDAVAELAGMPGLLARVPTGEVLAMGGSRGSWWLRSHRHRSCPCCRRSTGAGGSTCSSQPSPRLRWSSAGWAGTRCQRVGGRRPVRLRRRPLPGLCAWPSRPCRSRR